MSWAWHDVLTAFTEPLFLLLVPSPLSYVAQALTETPATMGITLSQCVSDAIAPSTRSPSQFCCPVFQPTPFILAALFCASLLTQPCAAPFGSLPSGLC